MSSLFSLESSTSFPLPAAPTTISTYKHNRSNFRIIFCPLPGPLVSTAIVVPTLAEDDSGLAHTLEHLIFCGSRKSGYGRGYLDTLANRCLSTGTNAYTTEDHTAYTITTAGSDGMIEIFPVFLEHVLYPTLNEHQFATEVYHLDGEAKHQGVVYCEMAGRENTESDMLDLALRRLLFQNETTYSKECGGLTSEIKKLTNDEIINYHKRFYHLDNLTAIVCGQIQPETLFEKLVGVNGLLDIREKPGTNPVIIVPKLPGKPGTLLSECVRFPSSDEEVGSIAYGWRGPPSEDIFTIVALDVVFRYLQETAASPFSQAFVERDDPYAAQVDFDIRGYVETAIELCFSGVPHPNGTETMETDESDGDESDYSEQGSEGDESEAEDGQGADRREDLFEPGVYHGLVMDVLQQFVEKGPSNPNAMQFALKRHRRKILEALEEEPHDSITTYIVPDVIRHSLAANSALQDTRSEGGKPVFGTRAKILNVLDELITMPITFWCQLVKRWLIDAPIVEVKMIPDPCLAESISRREAEEQKARVGCLGEAGLVQLKLKVEEAVEANKVHITDEHRSTMPPVPDVNKAPQLEAETEIISIEGATTPFKTCQLVKTETAFVHLRMAFNTDAIPDDHRPYLVLFQELIFQTPLTLPTPSSEKIVMDYRDVVRRAADLFVSYEAAVGFGNELWSVSWLSEVFMLSASAERAQWESMVRFLCQAFIFATFTEERIVTTAKNLLSEIVEIKRDGPAMLSAVTGRISLPFDKREKAQEGQRNDLAISLFKQEGVLKNVLRQCKTGQATLVSDALENVKRYLLGQFSTAPGFMQIAVPLGENGFSGDDVTKIWDEEVQLYNDRMVVEVDKHTQIPPFPFPRKAYETALMDQTYGNAVLVPMADISSSYLVQMIPCDIMRPHPHPDYYAVSLLAELLTRAEGPLYTSIRGRGYAYDASIHISLWAGQMSFELHESSEPYRALMSFYDILMQLASAEGFDDIVNENVEPARASLAYKSASARSTSGGVIVGTLRGALRGFKTLEEEEQFRQGLYAVTREDLRRAHAQYFMKFFDEEGRITIATTPSGAPAQTIRDAFATAQDTQVSRENRVVRFRETTLDELVV